MISPGESVKAAILRQRFFTSISFNTVLNCFLCTATHNYLCLQSVFKIKDFFPMAEKHSPKRQKGYQRNHLPLLAKELGKWGSPHTPPQISRVPLVMSLCSPAPQFPGCSPAARSRPRFPPLPGFVGCVHQRPWHSYNRRAFQIPEINREPTAVFTYRTHERFHFDRQT